MSRKGAPAEDPRVRELADQLRELEERTGAFKREADSGAKLIAELEKTLRLQDDARRKLESVIARQAAELESWRREAAAWKGRAEASEAGVEKLKRDAKAALEAAEAVRREGVEALEQARALRRSA